MPKKSHKVPLVSKKVKVLNLLRKGKASYTEVAKIYGKEESSILEIVKEK